MESSQSVRRVTLERMRLILLKQISGGLIDRFAEMPDVALSEHVSFMSNDVVFRVIQTIAGREAQCEEARYPADWWQAFKARWFPEWAKKKWPVREAVIELKARELYPLVALPHQEHAIVVEKLEWVADD